MRTRVRAAAVMALGAAAVVAAVGIPAGTAAAAVPLCSSAQLRPALDHTEGAAGHVYYVYRFTNVGNTCHSQGWVGEQLFGTDGRPLPTHPTRQGVSPSVVTLAHNGRANWAFGYTNPSIINCIPTTSAALTITPPGNVVPVFSTHSFSPCNGQFLVYPVQHS